MEINEKINSNNNLYLLKSAYLLKTNFPSANTFYIILFFLKYLGIIANSRIIEEITNKDNISINKYLKNFFIFGNSFSAMYKNYFSLIIFGAFVYLAYFIYFIICIFYMRKKYKKINSILDEKIYCTDEKFERIIFKIISYITIILIFFHQYIFEYYSFGIYTFIFYQLGITTKAGVSKYYVEKLDYELIDYFDNTNHILIFIINLITIIFIIFNLSIYMAFNSIRGLFLGHGIFSGNMKFTVIKIIIFNMQPLYLLTKFFNDDTKITVGIIYNVIIIFLCLVNFWSSLHQFGYYPNQINNMCLYIEAFVFISSLAELINYYLGYKPSTMFFSVKLFLEIINTFFFKQLIIYFKNRRSMIIFSKNLFSKNSTDVSKSGLYFFMKEYLDYQKNKSNNYLKLFRIILAHVKQCKRIDCPGQILISKEYLKSPFLPFSFNDKKINKNKIFQNSDELQEKSKKLDTESDSENYIKNNESEITNEKSKNNDNKEIIIENKKLNEKQFQIIFEQEIMNKIEYSFKSKKICELEQFIFIHIQYLFKMKKNYALALYYIGKYTKCGIKWSFITQYYLFEYKKIIINSYFNKLNVKEADKFVNKYRKDNLFNTEIIDYFVLLALLNNFIISSCDKLKVLFNFRKNLHNPLILKTYKHSNTNVFFKKGAELKYNIDKILQLTRASLNESSKDNISAELSYLISNFLLITMNKIPDDLRKIINPSFDINVISSKLESGFKFFNLKHPMILSLTKNNTFEISYFSCVISNRLGFHQYELKNKDFHEKLFPGVKFIKQHELLMKQFLFFSYNAYVKTNTFLKNKEGYLMGVSVVAKKYPNFFNDFFIILGIDFNEKLFYARLNKCFNRYTFILDENWEFVSETRNFFEEFEFNVNIFKEIRTNFLEFFCVDKNRIMKKITKKNNKIYKHSVNNVYNLKKDEDAFTLFKNISYEKAYQLRDISKIENFNNDYIVIHDKIEKDKILKLIPELSKLIEEYGLDFEWYQHLQNLTERLSLKESKLQDDDLSSNTMNTLSMGTSIITSPQVLKNNLKYKEGIDSINYNDNKGGRLSYVSLSSNSKKNFGNKIIKICLERNFDAVYNLKKIGTVYYYVVDLYEKTIFVDDNSYNNFGKKHTFGNFKKNKKNNTKIKFKDEVDSGKLNKAKTIFNNKFNIDKKFNFPQKNGLIDEDDNDNDNDKNIVTKKGLEKVKTWNHEKNSDFDGNLIGSEDHNDVKNNTNIISRKQSREISSFNAFPPRLSGKNVTKKMSIKKLDKYENNNYKNYNYRNSKDDDDENASFISKDQIDELRKKSNYINKIYILILIIAFAFTIIVMCIKLYFTLTNFSYISYLTNCLIFLEGVKADIFAGSIIILSQCLRSYDTYQPTGLNLLWLQLSIKSADLMNNMNSFEQDLNLINEDKVLKNVIQLFYKNITIAHLNKDWSEKIETSYLLNELYYFAYLLNIASQKALLENVTCNFENNFYLLASVNNSADIYELSGRNESSFNQQFIYYVLQNVIYEINPVFDNTLEEIVVALVMKFDSYLNKIVGLYICLIIFVIVIETIFLLKTKVDVYFLRQIFLFLYNYENNQLKKEIEINYLENAAKEFNIDNLVLLEKIKKDNNFFYNIINNRNSIFSKNEVNNENESHEKINSKPLINQEKNENQKENNNYQKIKNDLDQNSMSGSVLNNSMNNNGSMVQLLNKNNNKNALNDLNNQRKIQFTKTKRPKKNKSKVNEDNSNKDINLNEEERIFKENEDVLELLKTNRKIIPLNMVISIYASIVISLLFLLIIIVSVLDLYSKRNTWEYAVNLSMNYLEKVPKINELGFTTYLSAILGKFKANYYSYDEYKLHQSRYLRYFTTIDGYDTSELLSKSRNSSYFSNKLYDNYRLKKNIEFCENDKSFKSHFLNSKSWNKKLSEKNNFCINAALGSALFFNRAQITTVFTCFVFIEQMAYHCREESPKLDESGLDLEIDFILQELSYLFNDFEENMKTNLTNARNIFFGGINNNLRILKDMNVPFSFATGTLYSAVSKDMEELNNYISRYEIIFIVIIFIIDGLFLLYIFTIIVLNEKDKNILTFVSKVMKTE